MLTFDNSIGALVSDIVDDLKSGERLGEIVNCVTAYRPQTTEIGLVECSSESARERAESLKLESDTEGVKSLVDEVVN